MTRGRWGYFDYHSQYRYSENVNFLYYNLLIRLLTSKIPGFNKPLYSKLVNIKNEDKPCLGAFIITNIHALQRSQRSRASALQDLPQR